MLNHSTASSIDSNFSSTSVFGRNSRIIDSRESAAKAIRKYEELKQTNLPLEIKNLQSLLHDAAKGSSQAEKKSRFMVKSGQSIKTISSEKVAYFLAEDGVVLLVTFEANRFVVNYTLDQLEEMLDLKTFFRTNRQLIANIRSVKEVSPYFKGRLHLVLNPSLAGDQIISSSKASAFKDWLDL